VLETKIYVYNF
jgi:WD40 repeat protein